MKSQRAIFKWTAMAIVLAVFLAFVFVLPSASAQEENPLTPTPDESSTPIVTDDETAELAPSFVAGQVEPAFQLFSLAQPSASAADNLVAGGDSIQTSTALVYNPVNREYLVVWVDDAAPATLRGRFTSEAAVPGGEEFVITHGIVSTPTRPEVVYNSVDNSYLLLWSELNGNTLGAPYYPEPAHNLYALKLANDGNPVSSSPTLISNQMGFFFTSGDITLAYAVAYNSNVNEFLVAWTQPTGAIIGNYRQAYRVMGQRLAPDGTLRAGQVTIKIGVFASIGLAYGPASNEYLLTWGQYFSGTSWDLFAQRLRADTLAVSGSTIGLGTGQGRQGVAALAYSPSTNDYFVTWMASPLNDSYLYDVVGRRVHAGTGTLVGPLLTILHDSTDTVYYNDIAYNPVEDRFLVSGKLPTKKQFIGRYVTPLGELPEETFQITTLPLDGIQGTRTDGPRIAARSGVADGHPNFVAAWKTNDDIYARAIGIYDCSGTTLTPIAQAVFDVVGEQEYCGNHFDSLITLPPGQDAFQKFQDLAETAIEPGPHEIDFVTMGWDIDKKPNIDNDSRVEYSYNLFDDCDLGTCTIYWRLGQVSASSSEHDNLFDLHPLFSGPENGAYQLSFGSPAIDAGDPSLLHDLFLDGNNDGIIRIDLGAFEYVPGANVSPVVNASDDQTVELGNSVAVNVSYSDADDSENHSARIDWGDGIIEDVPTNMTGPGAGEVAGQHTYTSPSAYTVEICVVDIHGGVGCDTLSAAVLYHFTGFFLPVDNQPTLNVVKAGSAIPVKFSLDGDQGLNIFSAGYPASDMVTCGSSIEDAIEQTVTAGASSLSYDATTDQYIYVWKSDKSWADTCRTFVLKLNDGSYHRADFKFKK